MRRAAAPTFRMDPFTKGDLRGDPSFSREALALTQAALKPDPRDPLLLAYETLLQTPGSAPSQSKRKNVQAILDEATRRGDQKAVKVARELLAGMDAAPGRFEPEWDFDGDDEDGPGFPLPDVSAEEAEAAMEVLAMLAGASGHEIDRRLRNPPKGFPKEILETLRAAARQGPKPKSAAKPKAAGNDADKSKADRTNPDHLEMF